MNNKFKLTKIIMVKCNNGNYKYTCQLFIRKFFLVNLETLEIKNTIRDYVSDLDIQKMF